MNPIKHFLRFSSSLFLLSFSCLEAAGVEFTETSDFSGNLGSPAQITPDLETGINKIHGSVPEDFGFADTDVFEVQLPAGLTISSISIEVSNFVPAGSEPGRFEILFAADGNTGSVSFPSDGVYNLPFSLRDPTRIAFRISGPEDFMTFTAGSFDYTVNIAVKAAAVEFTETSDFSGNLGSPAQITPDLETGINKIHGSVPQDFGFADTDVFEVQLPAGLTISSISIEVSNFAPAGSEPGRFEILFAADGNTGSVSLTSDGVYNLPYSLGDPTRIAFRISGPEDFMTFTAGSFDYTVKIAVMHQQFDMTIERQETTEVKLSWPTVNGRLYRLEHSPNLESASWQPLGEFFGDGFTITVNKSIATSSRGFYRVMSP